MTQNCLSPSVLVCFSLCCYSCKYGMENVVFISAKVTVTPGKRGDAIHSFFFTFSKKLEELHGKKFKK